MPISTDVITFRLQGQIREDQETKCFVSYSPGLDIYSAGTTRMNAKNALQCAADLFIRICLERGILWKVLQNLGFGLIKQGQPPDPGAEFVTVEEQPVVSQMDYDDVFSWEVPLNLIAARHEENTICLQ